MLSMHHLWIPYGPLEYLEKFCELHKPNYKLTQSNKQCKETNAMLQVKVALLKDGEAEYEAFEFANNFKSGRQKAALSILRKMYGPNQNWKDLQKKLFDDINISRE